MLPCTIAGVGKASEAVLPLHHGGSAVYLACTVKFVLGTISCWQLMRSLLIDDHNL